jgi:hypothetical protein
MTDNGNTATAVRNGWTIEWEGHTWHSTETTTQQLCAVAETLGIWDWSIARPDAGPRQLAIWLAVLWSTTEDDLTLEQATLRVLDRSLAEVLNALTTGT